MGITVKKDKTDPFYNGDDDIENSSVGGGSTTLGAASDGDDTDEIAAVQKFSEKDTRRIRAWRYVIAATLLVTALAVTLQVIFKSGSIYLNNRHSLIIVYAILSVVFIILFMRIYALSAIYSLNKKYSAIEEERKKSEDSA